MQTYFRLLGYARPLSNFVIPFVLCSVVAAFFAVLNLSLLIPLLNVLFDQPTQSLSGGFPLNWIESFVRQQPKLVALKWVCVFVVGSVLLSNVFKYFSARLLERFKSNLVARLRQAIFDKTLRLHLGYFSNEKKGNLISKIISDVQEVENSIAHTFSAALKESFLLLAYLIQLFVISTKLTLFALIIIPISGGFISFLVKKMRRDAGEGQKRLGNILTVIDEAFGGMRVVKGFVAEKFIQQKFANENTAYQNAIFSLAKKRELSSPFSETMGVSVVSILLLYGGSLVLAGTSDLGAAAFVSYLALFSQLMRPAKDISNAFSNSQRGIIAGQRILDVIDTEADIVDTKQASTVLAFEDAIVFQHVGFSYNADRKILDNIDFRLEKGKTIALVGSSGGGKSTIADLVPRFYDCTDGDILIDGISLKACTQHSLRQQIGIVTQEPILFNDSIANNIDFGTNATKEEIISAAKVANAHDFIMQQPQGYETPIGDRGTKLSGGQRQRISIARAILKNPPILILDEATSALDTESEKLVQDALTKLMENRTTLVIAHRLSTIQHADQILVIHEGKIIERGTHDSLLQITDGFYRKLSQMQG